MNRAGWMAWPVAVLATWLLLDQAGARGGLPGPAAPAVVSSNWAGYVARGSTAAASPISFSDVSGRWMQPRPDCGSTAVVGPTSSAFWVGLGGQPRGSGALEQVGTEADCTATGLPRAFAWYELAPGPWVRVPLRIRPGDAVAASVGVAGSRVTVRLRDLTRGTSFARTLAMAAPAMSSADWIVEPPSVCTSIAFCGEQRLTDFGSIRFAGSRARSGSHAGTIGDEAWVAVRLSLHEGGAPFGGLAPERNHAGAVASALTDGGSAFTVRWFDRG